MALSNETTVSFRVRFFIGKGGVGKTTIAATYALMRARAGDKVLIVSLDPAHNLGDVLKMELREEPKRVMENLEASEVDFDKMVKEYMENLADKVKDMYGYLKVFNLEGYVDTLKYSPGIEEHATLEKIKEILSNNIKSKRYDVVVFDTPPTGLTVRMMALPKVTLVWLDKLIELRLAILGRRQMLERALGKKLSTTIGGKEVTVASAPEDDPVYKELMAIKEETEWLNNVLTDDRVTAVTLVINPEVLPVLEAERAADTLRKLGIPLRDVVINKVIKLETPPPELQEKIRDQNEAIALARKKFAGMDITEIPYFPWEPVGIPRLEVVANYLKGD